MGSRLGARDDRSLKGKIARDDVEGGGNEKKYDSLKKILFTCFYERFYLDITL